MATPRSASTPNIGYDEPCGAKDLTTAIGELSGDTKAAAIRATMAARTTPIWTTTCVRGGKRLVSLWAYQYPPRRRAWKKTMQVFQAAGLPPRRGRIFRPTIG